MVRIVVRSNGPVADISAEIDRETQASECAHDGIASAEIGIGADTGIVCFRSVMVLIKVAYNIETGGLRTTVCTIVVLSLTIFVQSILTTIIFQVNRVDRSHKLGCVPGISSLCRRILRTIGIRVGIAQVTADLHPLGDVVVNATTDGVSVEFRGDQDTPVIQITRRQIVAGLIRTSGNTDLIILSIGLMVGLSEQDKDFLHL